jgi:hypothetical protein
MSAPPASRPVFAFDPFLPLASADVAPASTSLSDSESSLMTPHGVNGKRNFSDVEVEPRRVSSASARWPHSGASVRSVEHHNMIRDHSHLEKRPPHTIPVMTAS